MKGKLGVVLSICLLTSQVAFAGEIQKLAADVLFGAATQQLPKPDDLRPATIAVAAGCAAAGAGLYFGADKLTGLAEGKVGQILEMAVFKNAFAGDVVRATGLGIGALGVTCVFQDGPQKRQVLGATFAANWCRLQMATWGTQVANETRDCMVQAILAVPAFGALKTVLGFVAPGLEVKAETKS